MAHTARDDLAVLAVRAAAHRLDNSDQQPCPAHPVPLCNRFSTVQSMSSDVPTDIMELELAEHGPDARVVTAVGEIDTLSALELAAFLITQLAAARVVVVDLDSVRLLGSAGLVVLFEANELATQQDCALRLVCNSPIANRALETTGLREHFTFAANVADALKN